MRSLLTTMIAVVSLSVVSVETAFGVDVPGDPSFWDNYDFNFGAAPGHDPSYVAAFPVQSSGFAPTETLNAETLDLDWTGGDWGGQRSTNFLGALAPGEFTSEIRFKAGAANSNLEFTQLIAGLGGFRLKYKQDGILSLSDIGGGTLNGSIDLGPVDATVARTYRVAFEYITPGVPSANGRFTVFMDGGVGIGSLNVAVQPSETNSLARIQMWGGTLPFDMQLDFVRSSSESGFGAFTNVPEAAHVPEPATAGLLGLGGLLMLARRRRA